MSQASSTAICCEPVLTLCSQAAVQASASAIQDHKAHLGSDNPALLHEYERHWKLAKMLPQKPRVAFTVF